MTWPPSSGMTAPAMNAAAGLSSSVIHSATSSGAADAAAGPGHDDDGVLQSRHGNIQRVVHMSSI